MAVPTFPVNIAVLDAMVTQPVKWITVIRQGETLDTVLRYVNDWPTYPIGDGGIFLVCIPDRQTWVADRLASGLFYAKVHDTYEDASADAFAQSLTLIR